MLEKLIICLERLQVRLEQRHLRRQHDRFLRTAKLEINRLSRMRLI